MNCAANLAFRVLSESIVYGGSQVNQLSASAFKEVGKTLQ